MNPKMFGNEKPINSCQNPGEDDTPGQGLAGADAALLKTGGDAASGSPRRGRSTLIDRLWNSLSNGSNKGKGVTPARVGKVAGGWSAQRVRSYARKGWFPKSLPSHLKNGRYAFDPNKVMVDIADIKKRLGIDRKKR